MVAPVKFAFVDRWIVNPVSLVALSVQVRLICVGLTAVATRFDGAAGEPATAVKAEAMFDQAEKPKRIERPHPVVVGGAGRCARCYCRTV